MSLTLRILLSFVGVAIAALYLLLNPILDRVERQYLEAAEEPMVDMAEILAAIVSAELATTGQLPAALTPGFASVNQRTLKAQIYEILKTEVSTGIYVTDQRGVVTFDSDHPARLGQDFSDRQDVYLTLKGRYGARSSRTNENDDLSSVMYVGAPLVVNGEIVGVLSVYKPQRDLREFILKTKRRILRVGLSGTAAFLLFGYLLSRWVTEPIARLTTYAEAVTRGERPTAPKLPGRHLRVLSESVERMREALEDRNYVGNYVQTLSHEMKAPVAAIRGAAELLDENLPPDRRSRFTTNIRSEAARLQRLIEQLLALASLESRKRLESPGPIDVAALARRSVDEARSRTGESKLDFNVDTPDSARILGDEFLLQTAVHNLIQNAVEFSPPGGQIDVTIERDDDAVTIHVRDQGPGLPDYAESRIFERFYSLPRPDSERKSSGLGLCFVSETAALHGGTVTVRNRTPGPGAEATVRLPNQTT
ncbi:MAG: two-component system sensor histidine kinase CreC [Chthoniobacterales bacterium]